MTQADTIANNLIEWMESNPSLDTLKKVAVRSGVGFGTVQRIKNGEGNPTRKSLEGIAKAFGRTAEDLLRDSSVVLASTEAAGTVGSITPATDPVLTDLATLDPEDANVWRAQICAAATKVRRQRAAETADFAPKPGDGAPSALLTQVLSAMREVASGHQDLPSNDLNNLDKLIGQLSSDDQAAILKEFGSAVTRAYETARLAGAGEPSLLNQVAMQKGLVHETPTTRETGMAKAVTAPASIAKRVRRAKA